jgi:hypothetical protein
MPVAVGPRPELIDDPGAETRRCIHKPVPDRLLPGRVLLGVPGIPLPGLLEGIQGRALGLREVVEGRGVGRRERRVEVDASDVLGVLLADARPLVAALRAGALIAEPGHQPAPSTRDALYSPAPFRRLVAEAVARKRRAHQVEGVGRHAAVDGGVGERRSPARSSLRRSASTPLRTSATARRGAMSCPGGSQAAGDGGPGLGTPSGASTSSGRPSRSRFRRTGKDGLRSAAAASSRTGAPSTRQTVPTRPIARME